MGWGGGRLKHCYGPHSDKIVRFSLEWGAKMREGWGGGGGGGGC